MAERRFVPTRNYDFQVTIKDADYSNHLSDVRIISSLSSAYQMIILNFKMDPSDITLLELYGQDYIKLSLKILGRSEQIYETIDFELMYVTSKINLPVTTTLQTKQNHNQFDYTPISIVTICRQPYKTMTTFINKVYENVTLNDVISDISNLSGAKLEIDNDGINSDVIDQIVIPPLSLIKSIKYLDATFGIYSGPMSIFCQYDNTLQIKNLNKSINKSQTMTITHLVLDKDKQDVVENSTIEPINFYTYDNLETQWDGNKKFGLLSRKMNYIAKPKDSLYYMHNLDLYDICRNNGLISAKNNKIHFDEQVERTSYHIDHSGYEENPNYALSEISKKIANLYNVKTTIKGNLNILNFLNVGRSVKLNTLALSYQDLIGKYILFASDIKFNKLGDWQGKATVKLMRTNKNN